MKTLDTSNDILSLLNSKETTDMLKKYNITTLCAFGSLINGNFNYESDVDLAITSNNPLKLDSILDLELFFENTLSRPIDILDLRSPSLDILVKINILNNCKIIFSEDDNKDFNDIYNETDIIYNENKDFFYFRKRDLLE